MILILKFIVIFLMLCGAICTLAPKIHGTIIILAAIFLYGIFTDFASFVPWIVILLSAITLLVEIGSSLLRIYLTKDYAISRLFAINALVGNLAGVIASDAILGSVLGISMWELISGKTLLPRFHVTSKIMLRLASVALFRAVSGIIMIILALFYIIN